MQRKKVQRKAPLCKAVALCLAKRSFAWRIPFTFLQSGALYAGNAPKAQSKAKQNLTLHTKLRFVCNAWVCMGLHRRCNAEQRKERGFAKRSFARAYKSKICSKAELCNDKFVALQSLAFYAMRYKVELCKGVRRKPRSL